MKGGSGLNKIDKKYVKQLDELQGDLFNIKMDYYKFMDEKINDYLGYDTDEDFQKKYNDLKSTLSEVDGKIRNIRRNWYNEYKLQDEENMNIKKEEIISKIIDDAFESTQYAVKELRKKLSKTFDYTIMQRAYGNIESIENGMNDFKSYFDNNLNSSHTRHYFEEILEKKYGELMEECNENIGWFKDTIGVSDETYIRYMNIYKKIRDTYADIRDKIRELYPNSRGTSRRRSRHRSRSTTRTR